MESLDNNNYLHPALRRDLSSINEVLECLDAIIEETAQKQDPLGYFAVLYRRVTWKVKEGIAGGDFKDGKRMEKLDVVFARRYIDAYKGYRTGKPVTLSWQKAFELSTETWPITMQHLLIGINAHINLDLGIAAAEVAGKAPVQELKDDFNSINTILAALVDEVQHNLSTIWPPLRYILLKTGNYDNLLVDFSMKLARDGAWRFAETLSATAGSEWKECIIIRDEAVAGKSSLITSDRLSVRFLLWIVRIGETGSVAEKIEKLKHTPLEKSSLKLEQA